MVVGSRQPALSSSKGLAGAQPQDPGKIIETAADAIRSRLGQQHPRIAVVLGSGLGFFTKRIEDAVTIPYREIPGFPDPTVIGHGGELVAGRIGGKQVIAQSGRFHLYEGHEAAVTAASCPS